MQNVKERNVCQVELRFGTIHFFLQFRLFDGVFSNIDILIIVKIHEKLSQKIFKEKVLVSKKYWSLKILFGE